jgi:hypothetical protein
MGELRLNQLGSALEDGWKDDALLKQMKEEALCDELSTIKSLVRAPTEGSPAVLCTATHRGTLGPNLLVTIGARGVQASSELAGIYVLPSQQSVWGDPPLFLQTISSPSPLPAQ